MSKDAGHARESKGRFCAYALGRSGLRQLWERRGRFFCLGGLRLGPWWLSIDAATAPMFAHRRRSNGVK